MTPGRYELPDAVLGVRLSIFGRSGYGKTNVAKRGVERLLTSKRRVGIIDPTDSWYGLRKKPDGKGDAFKVVIFGGEFGDLPLNEHAGATIGRALAAAKDSFIVSLAEMPGEGARKRFMADLLSALYDHNRAPLHLIVDEADTVAPQRQNSPAESICVARMEQIVKRGRKRGFVPWLITQRPADVATSVRSQTDALVSLSLTLPHDIKAVRLWVAEHDEDGTAAALFKEITKLPKGEGIVWWPGHVLERASFAKTKTFDSGKTPEAGDVRVKLKPLKVDALAKSVADLIKEREENAPDRLRARIAELERERDGANQANAELGNREEVAAAARQEGYAYGRDEGYAAGKLAGLDAVMLKVGNAITDGATATAKLREDFASAVPLKPDSAPLAPAPQQYGAGGKSAARAQESRAPAKAASTNGTALSDGRLRPGERTILTVLAQAGQELPSTRVAARARMARNGGTFKTYAARLRSLGFMYAGDPIKITGSGLQALGHFERLPTGRALREHWHKELRPGEVKLLEAVNTLTGQQGGHAVDAERVGRAADMPPTGGTFKTYMARLKSLGLITGNSKGFQVHEDLR